MSMVSYTLGKYSFVLSMSDSSVESMLFVVRPVFILFRFIRVSGFLIDTCLLRTIISFARCVMGCLFIWPRKFHRCLVISTVSALWSVLVYVSMHEVAC
jgi:hypothetical protein